MKGRLPSCLPRTLETSASTVPTKRNEVTRTMNFGQPSALVQQARREAFDAPQSLIDRAPVLYRLFVQRSLVLAATAGRGSQISERLRLKLLSPVHSSVQQSVLFCSIPRVVDQFPPRASSQHWGTLQVRACTAEAESTRDTPMSYRLVLAPPSPETRDVWRCQVTLAGFRGS